MMQASTDCLREANFLVVRGDILAASAAYQATMRMWPDDPLVLQASAIHFARTLDFPTSLQIIHRADKQGFDTLVATSVVTFVKMHTCSWAGLGDLKRKLLCRVRSQNAGLIEPFAILGLSDLSHIHRAMSKTIGAKLQQRALFAGPRARVRSRHGLGDQPLRLGYLGGNLNNHAVSMLLAGVIENHNRRKFSVYCYDFSRDDGTPLRSRMLSAFDKVVRLGGGGPEVDAACIAQDEIDILVDVQGYTKGTRSEILAYRPASIQVNFLGYPASLGMDCVDYVIGDKHVLPLSEADNWSEKIVHLPGCYQPNDRMRPAILHEVGVSRSHHGLPDKVVVFACFCSPYKITSQMFAAWMKILISVPESCLWLLAGSSLAVLNLTREAKVRQVDPRRLIFAPKLPFEAHIARHALVDVFLDTYPYNAHTTASDALWSCVPLVTLRGKTFPSRVASSALAAVSLNELICDNIETYHDTAVRLANSPIERQRVQSLLRSAKLNSPFFSAEVYTSGLEKAFLQMKKIEVSGRRPEPILL